MTLSTSRKPEDLPRLVGSGDLDIGCNGPMAVMLDHEQNPGSDLVIFCAVVQKDPFFLVGRAPLRKFTFSDLLGKILAPVTESPTPWLLLKSDLKKAELAPGDLSLAKAATMQENMDKFRRGELDVIQIPEPFVSQLESEGTGHVWYAGSDRGDVGFSALYTTRRAAEKSPDMLLGITRALYKTQKMLTSAPAIQMAEIIQPFLPEFPTPILAKSIENYHRHNVWADSPRLSRHGYERLREACVSGGLFSLETPYDSACIPRIAEQVIAPAAPAPRISNP